MELAKRLPAEIKERKIKPIISEYTVGELQDTEDTIRRNDMLRLISKYNIPVLPKTDEVTLLAEKYVSAGIIPAKYLQDACHIACAAIAGADYIVSLNFKHIVKHKTIFETEFINIREGYKRVFIHTPAEVINNE
ncbi:PIN domain-containing protein [Breznakiellaceae bacterium SP9]